MSNAQARCLTDEIIELTVDALQRAVALRQRAQTWVVECNLFVRVDRRIGCDASRAKELVDVCPRFIEIEPAALARPVRIDENVTRLTRRGRLPSVRHIPLPATSIF
jgi:hypothetical protein